MNRLMGKLFLAISSAAGMKILITFADGKVTPTEAIDLAQTLFSIVADVINDEFLSKNPQDKPPIVVPKLKIGG